LPGFPAVGAALSAWQQYGGTAVLDVAPDGQSLILAGPSSIDIDQSNAPSPSAPKKPEKGGKKPPEKKQGAVVAEDDAVPVAPTVQSNTRFVPLLRGITVARRVSSKEAALLTNAGGLSIEAAAAASQTDPTASAVPPSLIFPISSGPEETRAVQRLLSQTAARAPPLHARVADAQGLA
jgi:hypothetical protein